ncbi:hypothetical protein D9757_000301 [Collybiopsis confluens]|uniref:Uncharacterized protein n=1 Tax=Collybiopsis confluens TaxID=2823264 RepID=A0A8H5I2B3_9AGAR|nr:hypothetical protein D9757_000301 [Collybiopsis confluens]
MSQVFDGERNPADDEKYDLEEPFKYFRVGEEYPGTRDLASTELLSLLPGQQSWMNHQTLRLDFEGQNQEIVSIVLQVDASPGCGGVVWPAGQILSSYLIKKGSSYLRGMRVLDLGSGTGLVGLVAVRFRVAYLDCIGSRDSSQLQASLGADTVWITDQA